MTRPAAPLLDLAAGRPVAPAADLVASSIEHAMGGLVLSAAEEGRLRLQPDELLALSAIDTAVVEHHRRLWRTLASILDLLDDAAIAAYPVKGVVNERRWYERMGQRPCNDLDLVLAPDSLARIDDVLGLLAPDHPTRGAGVELVGRRRLQHVHFTFDGVAIDLHVDPLKLGLWTRHPERLWEATTTMADPAGRVVPVLEPAMALALALVHLNKDRFAYLGSYGEVVRILGDAALDWDTFDRFVTDEGLRVPVWSSLAEVVDRLGLDGPIPIDRAATRGWRGRLWRGLWPSRSRLRGNEGRRSHRQRQVLIPVISQARTAEVAAELRRRAVPPRSLLDLHRPELSGHRYLRRVTLDRLRGRRHR